MLTTLTLGWNGVTTAVNAAAQTKKTSNPTNIHAIPLMRRRFLRLAGTDIPAANMLAWELSNRTVSVYSASPSPSRNPQLRQKRNSAGIAEWQFEQVVTFGLEAVGSGISGFCDIRRPTYFSVKGRIHDIGDTPNGRMRLHYAPRLPVQGRVFGRSRGLEHCLARLML